MQEPNIDFLVRQLRKFRERLTNFSRRNRDLYFRSNELSINLSRNPFKAFLSDENNQENFERFESLVSHTSLINSLMESGELNLNHHFLFDTNPTPELHELFERERSKLIKKLDKIRLADRNFQKEYGISGAWLLGPFICWRNSRQYEKGDIVITPIFRIPIDLMLDKKKVWTLALESQDITINPSLRLFMRNSWGIELPEKCEENSVAEALRNVEQKLKKANKRLIKIETDEVPKIPARSRPIRDEEGQVTGREPVILESALNGKELEIYNLTTSDEFVLVDVFHVSHVNASKMALVEDYDQIIENAAIHPIISELLLGTPVKDDHGTPSTPRELDSYKEYLNHFVVDIDSTQHRAIESANKGSAIAIQGPPGTGKSQTITNLIADCLAKGKKVLFVSEKRAALDVVYTRLKKAEISNQSVLLHSSDLNRTELYKSFLALADSQANTTIHRDWNGLCSELDEAKSEITGYRDCLAQVHEESQLTASEVCARYAEVGERKPVLKLLDHIGRIECSNLDRLASGLAEIERLASKIPNLSTHPWLNKKAEIIASSSFKARLFELHSKLSEACSRLIEVYDEILSLAPRAKELSLSGLSINESDVVNFEKLAEPLQECAVALGKYLEENNDLDSKITTIRDVLGTYSNCFSCFDSSVGLEDVKELGTYFRTNRNILDWFNGEFRKKRRIARSIIKDPSRYSDKALYQGYLEYVGAFTLCGELLKNLKYPLIPNLREIEPILGALNEIIKLSTNMRALSKLRHVTQGGELSTSWKSFQEIINFIKSIEQLNRLLTERKNLRTQIEDYRQEIESFLNPAPTWNEDYSKSSDYSEKLLSKLDDLDNLDGFSAQCTALEKRTGIKEIRSLILNFLYKSVPQDWSDYVTGQIINRWYDEVRAASVTLRQYDHQLFHSKLARFHELEKHHRESSREVVINKWAERWQKQSGDSLGLRLLSKEANKKRKVLTPREIMEQGALKTMISLKPIWLMSPLSISQMLPLEKGLFDIIIFDEASQVRVEDAIPSIYRATSMVVVGDQQQMPPTNFFGASQETDDDEDGEDEIPESILDLALQVYPDVLLEWHYRSRSEALIAFSNRAFYGGRLIAAPNPSILTEGRPIEFCRVEDAYFNTKSGNQREAEAVVDCIAKLIRENPERSIGVLAMGQSQAKTINEVIEERMSADSDFRTLIENASSLKDGEADIGFFVKNLENVQGDERDVIVISVGYAPSSPAKKLYKNFGPISKKGGGRRLNVAITRAKQKVVVFCSFNPDEITTDEAAFASNPDSVYFGKYLKFARAVSENNISQAQGILNSFPMGGAATSRKPTRFNLDVKRRLEAIGYKVSTEIGTCGYFIDLGIHHPIDERRFALGVECDGATFHSTQYARDRDKIREQLLKDRGWNIARIWSLDWSKDWQSEVARLDGILKELMATKELNAIGL